MGYSDDPVQMPHFAAPDQGLYCLLTAISKANTVDSRYFEIEGTIINTSRYPYFDIPDL